MEGGTGLRLAELGRIYPPVSIMRIWGSGANFRSSLILGKVAVGSVL